MDLSNGFMAVYEDLAGALDRLPNGFPRTSSGVEIEILKKIFTPEEAHLASQLGRAPLSSVEIAGKLNLPAREIESRLLALTSRQVVRVTRENAALKFRLAPYVIGIYEAQEKTMDHELAHLCEKYWVEGGARGIMSYEPAIMRAIPAFQAFGMEYILPYEDVRKIIAEASSFEVTDCICRKQLELAGKRKCQTPVHVCLTVSKQPKPQGPDSLTQEEALAFLKRVEDIGLVHTVSNHIHGTYFVCNCCGCCCGVLRGINEFGIENSVAKTSYYAVVDDEKCTLCGMCAERCQVYACKVEETVIIDLEKCIGCGLCVTGCPGGALQLRLKEESERKVPPADFKDWEEKRLQQRGSS